MCLTFAPAVLPATGNPIACSSSTAPKICIGVKNKLITIHRKGRFGIGQIRPAYSVLVTAERAT